METAEKTVEKIGSHIQGGLLRLATDDKAFGLTAMVLGTAISTIAMVHIVRILKGDE